MMVENKLDGIFKKVGVDFAESPNLKDDNLFGSSIGLNARDLLIIFFMIEEEFAIRIPQEVIIKGEFNTYSRVLKIIKDCL